MERIIERMRDVEYLLKTTELTKTYGNCHAADHINIHVRSGDIYGLVGRNGAGKTTLLKMISGLSAPSKGDFTLFGYQGKERERLMHRIGTLIESPGIYPSLSAWDNLKLKCIAMGVRDKTVISQILEIVGLADTGKKKVGKFSLGMKQRLGLALALVGNPDLVILDEPINGLDPQGIVEIRTIVERLNQEKNITFIISSHILEELSKIATVYGIIQEGTLVQEITQKELQEKCSRRIELKTQDTERVCTLLERMNIFQYKVMDQNLIHIFERLQESGKIATYLATHGVEILQISTNNETLEDYYMTLTGGHHYV